MPGLGLLALTILMLLCSLATTCFAQSAHNQDDLSARARQSLRLFLQSFDNDLKDRFVAALADLNGDRIPEAIVYLTSNNWCGSGGCTTLILVRDADSWRLLTKIPITRPPLRVLTRRSNGWRNLGVWVQGGGIQPGYEAELLFDGKTYPTNPSMPPARPLVGKAKGEAVISPSVGR
jgi:hypothetical protein